MTRLLPAAFTLLSAPSPTRAQTEEPGRARLELTADAACVTGTDLTARVRARSPRVRFVEDRDAVVVRARVTAAGDRVTGELSLANPGEQATNRRVVARSCDEAADAMALIIAVTLDPTATTGKPAPDTSSPATPDSPASPAGTNPAPAATPPAPNPPSSAPATPADRDASSDDPATQTSPGRARFSLQLAFQSFVGPAPEIMPGIAAYGRAELDRPSPWSPSAILGVTYAARGGFEQRGGSASFSLLAASLDACPFRVTFARLELRPCASLLFGRLAAEGTNTLNSAGTVGRPFWVAGGAATLTFPFTPYLEASARVAVGGNLVRDSFVFTPTVFHAVPAATLAASAGLGVRFP